MRVEVHSEIRAFNEIGQRYATQLRPGNVAVSGTIGRAYINGAMLRLMLGEAADSRPAASWTQPAFNITLLAAERRRAGRAQHRHPVRRQDESWVGTWPEDDFLMESVGFQALYLTVADEE